MQHVQHTFSALLNQLLNGATCQDKPVQKEAMPKRREKATLQAKTTSQVHFFLSKYLLNHESHAASRSHLLSKTARQTSREKKVAEQLSWLTLSKSSQVDHCSSEGSLVYGRVHWLLSERFLWGLPECQLIQLAKSCSDGHL